MIKGINPTGKYMYIHGGTNSSTYISPGAMGAGMVRWNSNMNCLEVNDGNSWKTLDMGYASVGLTPEAESLLDWAKEKRNEDQRMAEMADKYPALKKAKENLDIVWNLVKDEHENQI